MKWKLIFFIIIFVMMVGITFTERVSVANLSSEKLEGVMDYSAVSTVTYDFTDKTNNKAYNATSGSNLSATLITGGSELPSAGYTNIQTNNNQNATVASAATNDYIMFRFLFNLNQSGSTINYINITWIGAETADGTNQELLVYNWTKNEWTRIGTISAAKGILTMNFTGVDVLNHIGNLNNNVTIAAWNPSGLADSGEQIRTDFIKLDVTYTDDNPKWADNATNGTTAGAFIEHSVNWTDDTALSGYIFSFDNGTGSFTNDSFVTFTGNGNWSNVSKWISTTQGATIRWYVWANDSANQVNSTDIFSYVTAIPPDTTPPLVTINLPQNTTYYVVYDLPFNFNVSLDEPGSVMYSLDNETGNVIGNTTMYNLTSGVIGTDFNSTLSDLLPGNYTFNAYANDTSGNNNYSENVAFTLIHENIIVNGTVSDASGASINTTFVVIDESDQSIVYNETNETHEDVIVPLNTTYTIQVQPLEIGSVDQIEFNNLNFSDVDSITTEIVNVDEDNNSGNYNTIFAIEPQVANFSDATVTFTAKSNSLFKCSDWNFTDQSCGGNWTLFMKDLVIGNQYNFVLNPGDPGYGIINISNATHLDENRSFISDITAAAENFDDVWTETIPDTHYVRAIFETPLGYKNDITIYPRTISGTPKIEVYGKDSSEKLAEFSTITDNAYNTILLTNLTYGEDTFDLRVVGGAVQLDHIVDPTTLSVTYDFTDKTNNKAYNATSGSNWTAATRFTSGTELPSAGYTDIQTNNNANATARSAATNDYVLFRYVFNLNQSESIISLLNITWIGARNPSTFTDEATLDVLVYNWTGNTWTRIGRMGAIKSTNTTNFTGVDVLNHIGNSNNNVTIVALNFGGTADSGEGIATDFIKLDVTYTDNEPQWTSNTTNGTTVGTFVQHSVNWTDDFGLSGYIFSFDNGTGYSNDTFVTFTGTQNWSNVSKWISTTGGATIRWYVWVNDTANNVNSTANFSYTAINNAPQWSQNTTNGTTVGAFIEHSVNWTDDTALSGYIFSFDNGTGSFSNNSFVTFTGNGNWSNVSKWISTTGGATIRWYVWANDSANNINSTSTFQYATTASSCWTYNAGAKLLIIPSGCQYYQSSGTIGGI